MPISNMTASDADRFVRGVIGTGNVQMIDAQITDQPQGQKAICIFTYKSPTASGLATLRITLDVDTSYPTQSYGRIEVFAPTGNALVWTEIYSLRGESMTDSTSNAWLAAGGPKTSGIATYAEWVHRAFRKDIRRLQDAAMQILTRGELSYR